MKKFICIVVSLLFVCLAFAGCKGKNPPGAENPDPDAETSQQPVLPDPSAVIASIGDEKITYAVYSTAFNSFIAYMGQFGYNPSSSKETLEEAQDMVVDMLVSDIVTLHHAKEDNFKLTEDELADIKAQADTYMQKIYDDGMKAAEQKFEKDASKSVEEYFDEYIKDMASYYTGAEMNYDEYSKFYFDETVKSKTIDAYMKLTAEDFVVSEDDITKWYGERSEQDEQNYTEHPEQYKQNAEYFEMNRGVEPDAYPPTYIPKGYSRIMDIAVYPSGELSDEYKEKTNHKQEIYDECTRLMFNDAVNETHENAERIEKLLEEYKQITAECDSMYEEYAKDAKAKINEAYAELENGKAFADVMLSYTEDTEVAGEDGEGGCEAFQTRGRLISAVHSSGTDDWSKTVKEIFAALSLGEYSKVFADEDGSLHIICYVSDEKEGTVGIEALHDAIKEAVKPETDKKAWKELIDAWKDDPALKIDTELIRLMGRENLPEENGGGNDAAPKP